MSDHKYKIHVPATSANIGPGFDVCGIALSRSLSLVVTIPAPSSELEPLPKIVYTGLDSENVPLSPFKNLLTRVALYVLRANGKSAFPPGVTIEAHNEIPFGRGLGSSGAAVIAGVLLGDLLGELNLPKARLLDFALMVERHPDNVTAALVGGFVGSYLRELSPEDMSAASIPLAEVLPEFPPDAGPQWGKNPPQPPNGIGHYVRFGWAKEIKAIAVSPRFELATAKARGVLPESYSKKDLIFNLQRLAVLTTALARSPPDPDLIYDAMGDRVHQPYRMNLIPGLPKILSTLTPTSHPGLLGICLSGAGPTILALATHNFDAIAQEIESIFGAENVKVDWKVLDIDERGSYVEEIKA
ncbi:homoserine kinase [Cryptococcus wingfieldii CBS 7118]|uniref:Homoserine kinase n=1 Tax=Cryptococcus wingfieldii CBS 7118 TaxID=1295528 RepID=A0A1E3JX92_9TREE|nr:homoserine kinase [Cryptococcus wingfieldii CBS 7118]ODO05423.1 homoserine kinase [Cryptococcus wingfieldii CBS 7118]